MNGYSTTHHMTQTDNGWKKTEFTTCKSTRWKIRDTDWNNVNCRRCLALRPRKVAQKDNNGRS